MRSGIFGWSLPPGVSMRDIDPPDLPCEVCGLYPADCVCPECPECSVIGDPACYIPGAHGMVHSEEQNRYCLLRQSVEASEAAHDAEMAKQEERWAAEQKTWEDAFNAVD